ncbi:MAG: response regulator transcription factor [Bacteroidetes bacterium]|nr:response regulator transcription factor [Bacteroidota bacterium]
MKEKIRIIIADDHQLIIDGIKSLLSGADDIKITGEASNGKEALELLKNNRADIAMLDIDMPVMSGYETAKQISEKYPDVKTIILTMFNEKSLIRKMIETGAHGYILKNITKDELILAIHEVAADRKFYSNEIHIAMARPAPEEVIKKEEPTILPDLTKRELEILKNITLGLTNAEIAGKLFISPHTVDVHRTHIMKKLDVHNVAGLVQFVIKNHLLD